MAKKKIHLVKAMDGDRVEYVSRVWQTDYNGPFIVEYTDSIEGAIHYKARFRAEDDASLLNSSALRRRCKSLAEAVGNRHFVPMTLEVDA